MGTPQAPHGRGGRERLSREAILDAALGLIDSEGAQALSMRRLGQWLGVEAMSLYRYVRTRDALIDSLVDRVVDDLLFSPRPETTWQDYLRGIARDLRAVGRAHPPLIPLIATRPTAPLLRPPLRSERGTDAFLSGLQARGFSEQDAVEAYRAFTGLMLAHLLLDGDAAGPPSVGGGPDLLPPAVQERLRAAHLRSDEEFARGLDALVERLSSRVSTDVD